MIDRRMNAKRLAIIAISQLKREPFMSKRIIAIGFAVLFVAVCGGLGFMIVKSATHEATPMTAKSAKDEVKAVVEPVKPVVVKAEVKAAEAKAKVVELTFPEATKFAIALLKKNADAEWVEAMRKFTDSEKEDIYRVSGRRGAEPDEDLASSLHRKRGTELRSVGLPNGALYAVGTCGLNDKDLKPMFEIVWANSLVSALLSNLRTRPGA